MYDDLAQSNPEALYGKGNHPATQSDFPRNPGPEAPMPPNEPNPNPEPHNSTPEDTPTPEPIGYEHQPNGFVWEVDPESVHQRTLDLQPNDKLTKLLTHIIDHEHQIEDANPQDFTHKYGWEPGDLALPGWAIRQLRSEGLLHTGYKSNSTTCYYLVHRDATKQALDDLAHTDTDPDTPLPPEPITVADRPEFHEVANAPDTLDRLTAYVAPSVEGLTRAKQALLLTLASMDDQGTHRARVHTMLYGPPGTAKTPLAKWVARISGTVVYSPRATAAGLTADMRTGEPGALPKAGQGEFGAFIVDELDDADRGVVQHTLQALAEGQFTVTSANGVETYQAPVRMVSLCNDIDGFSPEFLDRIDFMVHIPRPGKDDAKHVVGKIWEEFMAENVEDREDFIRDYLRWIRQHTPRLTTQTRRLGTALSRMLIDLHDDDDVRIRPHVSIIRTALSLARLEHDDVQPDHVLQAIKLLHPDLNNGKLKSLRMRLDHEVRGA